MLVAGPNGQGVISTPSQLCAQIVAPCPPRGRIGVASQSGNFVSSFQNYAVQTGIGISRGVSAGNAAMVGVPDYLEYYADDPETAVGLAYVEGIRDGRAFFDRLRAITPRQPFVRAEGRRDRRRAARRGVAHRRARERRPGLRRHVPPGRHHARRHRRGGVRGRGDVRDAAAARAARTSRWSRPPVAGASSPPTRSPGHRDLTLAEMPDDLRAEIDTKLPPRWSRNNPIDLAGGETRDTIPEVLEMVARHPSIDAIVYLGLGIQSNQAQLMKDGPYYPGDGLERIVAYHERQDERFARAAAEISDRDRQADPDRDRAGDRRAGQPGPAHRARDRPALLLGVEPRGRRARAPAALRAMARAARPVVTDPASRRAERARARTRPPTSSRRCSASARSVLIFLALQGPGSPAEARAGAAPRDAALVGPPRPAVRRRRSSASSGCRRRSTRPVQDSTRASSSPTPSGRVAASATTPPRIPASTQKLLTATAALDVLGAGLPLRDQGRRTERAEERLDPAPLARRLGRPGHHDARRPRHASPPRR